MDNFGKKPVFIPDKTVYMSLDEITCLDLDAEEQDTLWYAFWYGGFHITFVKFKVVKKTLKGKFIAEEWKLRQRFSDKECTQYLSIKPKWIKDTNKKYATTRRKALFSLYKRTNAYFLILEERMATVLAQKFWFKKHGKGLFKVGE